MRNIIYSFVVILLEFYLCMTSESFLITCPAGRFEGHGHAVSGRSSIRFLGIPFAKPPTGERRFDKPHRLDPIHEKFHASQYGPSCLQTDELSAKHKLYSSDKEYETSEDCLTLNIFLPEDTVKTSRHAVMVWLHGGGFQWGGSIHSEAGTLVARSDVIVVTVNYRLGVFGFLATEDGGIPGNFGLWDQQLALRWVHENIEYFGGDSQKVTLFGNSAGAAAITFQSLLKENKNYFQRAIAQSGTLVAKWASSEDVPAHTKELAGYLDCPKNNSDSLLVCLRSTNTSVLLSAVERLHVNNGLSFAFMPTYDGDFINYDPETVLDDHAFLRQTPWSKIDLLTGVNDIDGHMLVHVGLTDMFPAFLQIGLSDAMFSEVMVPKAIAFVSDHRDIVDLIPLFKHQYTDWSNISSDTLRLRQYSLLTTDFMFTAPAIRTLRAHVRHRKSSKTYSYYFGHKLPWSKISSDVVSGANHGDEVPFIFGFPAVPESEITTKERHYSRVIMEYWTNFAKSGNPNTPSKRYITHSWPQFDSEHENYMDLTQKLSGVSAKSRLLPERISFWLDLLPPMMKITEGRIESPPCYKIPIVSSATTMVLSEIVYVVTILLIFRTLFLL